MCIILNDKMKRIEAYMCSDNQRIAIEEVNLAAIVTNKTYTINAATSILNDRNVCPVPANAE